MSIKSRPWTPPAVALLVAGSLLAGRDVAAQGGVYAYPLQGQSQQQQQKDQLDCHNWAVSQTGFDPVNSPRPAPATSSYAGRSGGGSSTGVLGVGGDRNLLGGEGNVLSDAATGAAFGAIGRRPQGECDPAPRGSDIFACDHDPPENDIHEEQAKRGKHQRLPYGPQGRRGGQRRLEHPVGFGITREHAATRRIGGALQQGNIAVQLAILW